MWQFNQLSRLKIYQMFILNCFININKLKYIFFLIEIIFPQID